MKNLYHSIAAGIAVAGRYMLTGYNTISVSTMETLGASAPGLPALGLDARSRFALVAAASAQR